MPSYCLLQALRVLYSVCWSLSLSLSLSLCRRFPVLPHQKLSFRKKPFPSSSPKSVMHCRCPVCIVSFLCSFSWTSFHLLDSSMRLARSHSHSLTLCNSLSLSLSLCVVCHLSVPMFNSFHSPPFLTPCLFFPFCFVPCSRSGPTIVVYNGPLHSVCCSCVSAYHFLTCHLNVPMFNAYHSFLASFQLPLSLPFYLVFFSCPLACLDIPQLLARGSRTSLVMLVPLSLFLSPTAAP